MPNHLSSDFIEESRRILLVQKKELEDWIRTHSNRGEITQGLEPDQRGAALRLNDGLEVIKTVQLTSTRNALQRIEQGVYGICVDCKGHIPEVRLRAQRDAVTCHPCPELKKKR